MTDRTLRQYLAANPDMREVHKFVTFTRGDKPYVVCTNESTAQAHHDFIEDPMGVQMEEWARGYVKDEWMDLPLWDGDGSPPECPVCGIVVATHAPCHALRRADKANEKLKAVLLHVLDDLREGKYMHGATCTARRLEPCDCGLYELETYVNDALGGNVLDKSLRKSDVEKARDRAVIHGTEQESLYYREMTRAEEAETERDRLRQVIIEINSLESQARSGDAGALLEAEAKKAREAQGSGIVFTVTSQESEVRAIVDSEGNARLYPNRDVGNEVEDG